MPSRLAAPPLPFPAESSVSSPNTGFNSQPSGLRRERRNWKLRSLFALSRRPGPYPYWPVAALIAGVALLVGAWLVLRPAVVQPTLVPYSELADALAGGAVSDMDVVNGGAQIVATLRAPRHVGGAEVHTVAAAVPSKAVGLQDLERWGKLGAKVRVEDEGHSRPTELIIQLLSLTVAVAVLGYLVMRHGRGGLGSSKFVATPPSRQLTLADVGGAREAQADLKDVIAYLRKPARFERMGAKCPKGVLLVGPPGTGKTLLARAIAGEANVPVITAAGSDFNEMYVGVGSKRVRQLAKQARDASPCIVFIDEFDSLGGRRGRPNRSGEEEVTLNQLLVEMDGMAGSEGIIWMAATNREDMLDPA